MLRAALRSRSITRVQLVQWNVLSATVRHRFRPAFCRTHRPGLPKVQGAFVTVNEIAAVVQHCKEKVTPVFRDDVLGTQQKKEIDEEIGDDPRPCCARRPNWSSPRSSVRRPCSSASSGSASRRPGG